MSETFEQPPPAAQSPRFRWGTVLLTIGVIALYLLATRPAPAPEGWGTDFDAAVAEARATNRKILVAVNMPGCPACTAMDRTVLIQESVKEALKENYIPVRVDATRQPGLAGRLGAYATPTYVVVDREGRPIARREGLQPVEQFVTFLAQAAHSPASSPTPPQGD